MVDAGALRMRASISRSTTAARRGLVPFMQASASIAASSSVTHPPIECPTSTTGEARPHESKVARMS